MEENDIHFLNPAYKKLIAWPFLKLMKTALNEGTVQMNFPLKDNSHCNGVVLILSSYLVVFHLLLRRNFSSLISVWNTNISWGLYTERGARGLNGFWYTIKKINGLAWKLSVQKVPSPKMAAAWREYFSALTSAMSSWTSGRSCRNQRYNSDVSGGVQMLRYDPFCLQYMLVNCLKDLLLTK